MAEQLVPAALENAITLKVARKIKAQLIAEVANGPTTPEADDYFAERDVAVLPDILANAGGVTVSYYEWVQNTQGEHWDRETVEGGLKKTLLAAYKEIHNLAAAEKMPMRRAAYWLAIERVAKAMVTRGAQ